MPEFLKLIPPTEALNIVLNSLKNSETISEDTFTMNAVGRVIMEDVFSPQDLPNFIRSTVDGYAVNSSDSTYYATNSIVTLNCVGEIEMGKVADKSIKSGECLLIHTGGMLPKGADSVIMVEYSNVHEDGSVSFSDWVKSGDNLIQVGEDVRNGQLLIPKGKRLKPADIGSLLSVGIIKIRVAKRVTAGILSSGNEVIEPWEEYSLGKVRNINSYSVGALLEQNGFLVKYYGICADVFDEIQAKAKMALEESDCLVITAGSSASYKDFTERIINSLGEPGVLVHGVSIKPGKPTIMGICQNKPVIGLPGNPVSALTNAGIFLIPILNQLMQRTDLSIKPYIEGMLSESVDHDAGREEWMPVKISEDNGIVRVKPIIGKSNLIFNLATADGLLKIENSVTKVPVGTMVRVYPINNF